MLLDLTKRRLSSENYQIMNYGLGGAILTHRDSDDAGLDDPIYSESYYNGGPRLATVMIWLSGETSDWSILDHMNPTLSSDWLTGVEQGGRTVFDGAGVSVETRPGSALVWWNIRRYVSILITDWLIV